MTEVRIRGKLPDGQIVWYTGKGGNDWISLDERHAYVYTDRKAAAQFCYRHNAMYKYHRVLFSMYEPSQTQSTHGHACP